MGLPEPLPMGRGEGEGTQDQQLPPLAMQLHLPLLQSPTHFLLPLSPAYTPYALLGELFPDLGFWGNVS